MYGFEKKRIAIGKIAMEKEYSKINFEQAIDLVISTKSVEGDCPRTLKDYKKRLGLLCKVARAEL